VTAIENIVNKGGKVVESDVIMLTETLMNELIKLDGIAVDGDVNAQKKMQVFCLSLLVLCKYEPFCINYIIKMLIQKKIIGMNICLFGC
jgi:BAG domain